MKDVKYKYILCEFDFADIRTFPYSKISPNSVYGTLFSYHIKYGIPTLFYGNRVTARGFLYKLFFAYVKYEILKMDKREDL